MRAWTAFLLMGPLAGCALVEPHQHVPALTGVELSSPLELTGPLDPVLRAVRQQQSNYMAAVTAHSAAATAGPLISAALAASSIALTGAGAGSEALRFGLGAGALGAAGATTLLHNRARQEVYLAGVRALNCVLASEAPFLAHAANAARLDRALQDLAASRGELAEAQLRFGAERTGARWDNARLEALKARADRAPSARAALRSRADNALDASAVRLRQKAIDVVAAVDQRLVEAGRDPSAVLRPLLEGLGPMPAALSGFAGLPAPPTDGSGTAGTPASLRAAPDPVDPLADALARRVTEVEALLAQGSGIAEATPRGARACLAALRPNLLMLFPDEPVLRVRQLPNRARFNVRGGTGDRQVSLGGQFPGDSVSLTQRVDAASGHVVELAFTAGAVGATPRLIVADASGAPPIEVEIQVDPQAAEPAQTPRRPRRGGEGAREARGDRDGANRPGGEADAALNRAELAAVRAVVGRAAATEPQLTQEDRDAINTWALQATVKFQRVVTAEVRDALLRARREVLRGLAIGPEDVVSDPRILRMARCLLGLEDVTPTGPPAGHAAQLLTPDLRAKLFDLQVAGLRARPMGNLTLSARLDHPTLTYLTNRQRRAGEPDCRALAG